MRKHRIRIIEIAFFSLCALASSCSRSRTEAVFGSGTLEAHQVLISAQEGGRVIAVAIKEGESVRKGQLIARLDAEKLLLQRRQAEAALRELQLNLTGAERNVRLAKDNLELVQKKHDRITALLAENGATQQQFDEVDAARKAAEIQVDNARTTLQSLKAKAEQLQAQIDLLDSRIRDTELTSPLDGVVLQIYAEEGELVRPLGTVAEIADLSRMWVKIYVKETDLSRISLGAQAKIHISSSNQPIFGRVAWISERAEFTPKTVQTKEARADLTYAVKVEMENPDGRLKIGMPVDVTIE
ncbi:MAG: efflux RND transporter periplasmic adaptor subunit [candidate division KSB1 bacterium]|nr:efflux RND transporter periplasmic adaptor subunit [candidate division KSB1 bacterium]